MKKFPIIILWSWLALYAVTANAKGYMRVNMGAEAQFVYVQILDVMNGHLSLRTDVTGLVPHTVQIADGQKVLVIQ